VKAEAQLKEGDAVKEIVRAGKRGNQEKQENLKDL